MTFTKKDIMNLIAQDEDHLRSHLAEFHAKVAACEYALSRQAFNRGKLQHGTETMEYIIEHRLDSTREEVDYMIGQIRDVVEHDEPEKTEPHVRHPYANIGEDG